MSLWRLEWLRLVRTRRWIALGGVFVFFGLLGPITARYLGEILGLAGGELDGATIELPPPTPADGLAQFASNAFQIGTLVAVVVAAGSLAIDAIPEMGIFLRTRVRSVGRILGPRLAVTTAAVVSAFVIGGLVAWYETWALIGSPVASGVLVGLGLGALFLVFVVAVVAAVAGWATSVLTTVMTSIVVLLALPILGIAGAVGRWLPSHLAGALGELSAGSATAADYLPAASVTVVVSGALVLLGIRLAGRREL
jgi:ABC-2 type transport system permease protein